MPAFALPAELLAEEIAAQQIAAAVAAQQAAAALQAQQAAAAVQAAEAAQAAQIAQAAQAAQAGQATQTLSAAQAGGYGGVNNIGTNGIQALAQEVGATTSPTGIEQVFQQAQANNIPMSQIEQVFQQAQTNNIPMSRAEFLNNSFAGPASPVSTTPITASPPVTTQLPPFDSAQYLNSTIPGSVPIAPPAPSAAPVDRFPAQVVEPPAPAQSAMSQPSATSPVDTRLPGPVAEPGAPAQSAMNQVEKPYEWTPQTTAPNAAPGSSGIEGLLNQGIEWAKKNPLSAGIGAMSLYNMLNRPKPYEKPKYKSTFNAGAYRGYEPTPPAPYQPQYPSYAGGGPIEAMSNANAIGANTGYPMAGINKGAYATPWQTPISRNVIAGSSDTGVNPMTGEMTNFAAGGISDLGSYSDYARGGRMLKGPGDGMSDDIPATIANKQPARLANEEFVVAADVVSHLGNGSSEAGAKALYRMMDRVRQARTGTKKQGKQINPEKYLA